MAGTLLRQAVDTGFNTQDMNGAAVTVLPLQYIEIIPVPEGTAPEWKLGRLYDDDGNPSGDVWVQDSVLKPIDPAIDMNEFADQCETAAQLFGANHHVLLTLALYLTGCSNVAPRPSTACGPYLFLERYWAQSLAGAADLGLTALDRLVPAMQPFAVAANMARAMAAFREIFDDTRLPTVVELTFIQMFGQHSTNDVISHIKDPSASDAAFDAVVGTFCTAELGGAVAKADFLQELAADHPSLLGPAAAATPVLLSQVMASLALSLQPSIDRANATFKARTVPVAVVPPPSVVPTDVLPMPPSAPVPFAALGDPAHVTFWPVITDHPKAMEISYLDTSQRNVGSAGRKFFADRNGGKRHHVGMDVWCREGDVVIACAAGRIVKYYAFYQTSTGEESYALFLEHNGAVINYGEVKKGADREFRWAEGDQVAAGQKIARVSSTNMIHFEAYQPGVKQNERWMQPGTCPPHLLNPTALLLNLASNGMRIGIGGAPPPPPPPASTEQRRPTGSDEDLLTMARTIYGEARGQSTLGREAVGAVIMNRVNLGRFGTGISGVCKRKQQFSCWNSGDPNLPVISAVLPGANAAFDGCYAAAERLMKGAADPTVGATHYYAKYIRAPNWSSPPAVMTTEIGVHRFFRAVP